MICKNFDKDKDKCKYAEALIGTGEDPPTACGSDGFCSVNEEHGGDWDMADSEDCDMLNLKEDE